MVLETLRNGSPQLDLQMHCQTTDVEATHVGTWDIRLTSHEDLIIMQRSVNASINADSDRQGSVRLQFYIAVNQVNGAILQCNLKIQFLSIYYLNMQMASIWFVRFIFMFMNFIGVDRGLDAQQLRWTDAGSTEHHLYQHGRSVFDRQMDIGFRTVTLVQDELDTGGKTVHMP